MKTFEELMEEVEVDNKISSTNLEGEILRVPKLMTKYLRIHRQYKEKLIAAWKRQGKMELEKQLYYSGAAPSEAYRAKPFNLVIKNQTELLRWIKSDDDISTLTANIQLTESCMDVVEQMLDSLKYRSNHLATILEVRKFESGA